MKNGPIQNCRFVHGEIPSLMPSPHSFFLVLMVTFALYVRMCMCTCVYVCMCARHHTMHMHITISVLSDT